VLQQALQEAQNEADHEFLEAAAEQQEEDEWNQPDVEQQHMYAQAAGFQAEDPDEQAHHANPAPDYNLPHQVPPPEMDPQDNAADPPPADAAERRARRGEAEHLRNHANDPVVEGGRGSIMQVIMCMLTILSEHNVPHVVFDMFMRAVEASLPEGNNWPKCAPS
jgi:hypothetical protein